MFKHVLKITVAVAFGLVLNSVAHSQSRWEIGQIFSTADGSVQFIVLQFGVFVGAAPDLPFLAGQTLIASDSNAEHRFTFLSNVQHFFGDNGLDAGPCDGFEGSCWSYVLVATQGFADLNVVKPDFIVTSRFLFLPSGSVRLGVSESRYDALPAGAGNAALPMNAAFAINNNGEHYEFTTFDGMRIGINPLIEYYNARLDDYFLTAYATEIQILDSANASDWQRTGRSLPASVAAVGPPNLTSVCRVWLGDSHFYSISGGNAFTRQGALGPYSKPKPLFSLRCRTSTPGPIPRTRRVYIDCGTRSVRATGTRPTLSFATRC